MLNLADGATTYLFGLDRLGYSTSDTMNQFLPDALGSVRQVMTASGLMLTKSYDPYGEVIYSNGSDSMYGFSGEPQDACTGLVYLRARTYNPASGTFTSRDTWDGDANLPMSYNRWAYGYSNPVKYTDPSGYEAIISGIKIDDNFSAEEKQLITEAIYDYENLLGGKEVLKRNLAIAEINIGWANFDGRYNAFYDPDKKSILLPYGWYSSIIGQSPDGKIQIILGSPCLEKAFGFPEGSLPTDEISAKYVLTHEMTHALEIGNPKTFKSYKENVSLPWSIFAGFSSTPIIKRNVNRSLAREVFADTIPAYLFSQGLLNQDMIDWVEDKMLDTLK